MLSKLIDLKKALKGQPDRRESSRERTCKMLRIQPLTEDLRPLGASFWAYSKDFSENGFAFQRNKLVDFCFLKLTIAEEHYTAIAQVRHVSRTSGEEFDFTIGCQLIPMESLIADLNLRSSPESGPTSV